MKNGIYLPTYLPTYLGRYRSRDTHEFKTNIYASHVLVKNNLILLFKILFEDGASNSVNVAAATAANRRIQTYLIDGSQLPIHINFN